MSTHNRKVPKLTVGRYKLVQPCHVYRGFQGESFKPSEVETSDLPVENAAVQQVKSVPLLGMQRVFLDIVSNKNVSAELQIVRQYFQDTNIISTMKRLMVELLQNNLLPYNPYPGFIRRLRRLAERFHMRKVHLNEIRKYLDVPVFSIANGVLCGIKSPNANLWGLEHILGHTNSKYIESIRGLLVSSTLTSEKASHGTGEQVSVITSLCGPCIFNKSFYHNWLPVNISISVLVSSTSINAAAKIFAAVIIEDLKQIESQENHHFLGLIVAVEDKNGFCDQSFSRTEILPLPTTDALQSYGIYKLIVHAAVARKQISVNFVMRNPATSNYIPTVKKYYLIVLQTSAASPVRGRQPAQTTSHLIISTLPYQALFEGVFIDRAQAELYVSTFQRYFSPAQQPPVGNRRATSKFDPMHQDILRSVVQSWQSRIASTVLEDNAFTISHDMLLLHLTQTRTKTFSKHSEDDLAIQISRLYRGRAAQIKSAMSYHSIIEMLLTSSEDNNVTRNIILSYRSRLLDVLDADLCSRSSEMKTLKEMIVQTLNFPGNGAFVSLDSNKLHLLYSSISSVCLGLIEDALEECPAILMFKNQLHALQPRIVPRVSNVGKLPRRQHGIKITSWIDVDKLKINKQICIVNSQAPKTVASHYVLMQYCEDARLDQTWKEFIQKLLIDEHFLSPNPYPIIISLLRKSSMSVQTIFETDSTIVNRLFQHKIFAAEGSKSLYNVTGTTAFGEKSSLIFLNLLGFRQVSELFSKVVVSNPGESSSGLPILLGTFQVTICAGVVAPSLYHGCISPYLCMLQTDQHMFLRGPQNQIHFGAISLAKMLLNYLASLQQRGVVLHQACFDNVKLSLKNLSSAAVRFESEFSACVVGSQLIHISFYFPLEWRYILIRKRLLIYHVDELNERVTRMFPHGPSTDRMRSTIFMHRDDAAYCLRSRNLHSPDKTMIRKFWPSRDWPQIIQLLIAHAQSSLGGNSKNMMKEDDVNALVAYAWRYYSGTPGQMDYLISLSETIEILLDAARSALDENVALTNVIDQSLVEKMIDEYKIKLNEVVSRASSLSPRSLAESMQSKLNKVAFRDGQTNAMYVKYDVQSVQTLHDIRGNLLSLRNSSAEDLLNASQLVAYILQTQFGVE